jgi:dTDP-4-dehydrorhamnose reductase
VKLLILGGGGMFGHRLWLAARERHETVATARTLPSIPGALAPSPLRGWMTGVDAADLDSVAAAVASARPGVVVNCIGIVKQRAAAKDPVKSLTVNALFPHRLAVLCAAAGARLIHISTDCVFSGAAGPYTEADQPDAADLYGRSKLLGEVTGPGCLTLRTSIVGRELAGGHGLVEWFLAQPGPDVPGFTRAVFSGLTTQALAEVVLDLVDHHPALEGLYHVSADPIAKFEFLALLARAFGLNRRIVPVEEPVIDRSLDSTRFRAATGLVPPSWPAMVDGMARDWRAYGSDGK